MPDAGAVVTEQRLQAGVAAGQGSDLENYSLEIFVSYRSARDFILRFSIVLHKFAVLVCVYRKGAPMKRLGGETQSGGVRAQILFSCSFNLLYVVCVCF